MLVSKTGPQSGGLVERFVGDEEKQVLWKMLAGEEARRPDGTPEPRTPDKLREDVESFQPTSHVSIVRDYLE
jgi:hypothetical protein